MGGVTKEYTYEYDGKGNITSISDGTNTTSYVYDSANQLVRENNQAGNFTYTWTYDNAGNIQNRKEYAYTTGELGTPTDTVNYEYNVSEWKDLLTAYDGIAIEYDQIGNPLTDGTWTYTWQHGRQLASMAKSGVTWSFTYNADGLRTKRTNGTTTYSYVYNGSQLMQMTKGSDTLNFIYDAAGRPTALTHNGATYYYVTNIQGDIVGIVDTQGATKATYTYDVWGNILSISGTDTIGNLNPLRYRGYVYDTETGLYYLQSRYYNAVIGRFLNADSYAATGQGFIGRNMFAYCNNDPVNMTDTTGNLPFLAITAAIGAVVGAVAGGIVAAKSGGNVWVGIGIGAAAGALVGAGLGAAAGVVLTGSATASTAAVVVGAATLKTTVATGGLGAGAAYVANNILGNPTYTNPVLYSGNDLAKKAAENYAANSGGTVIGNTIINKAAEDLISRMPNLENFIWKGASELFCHQSTGSAYAFISNNTFNVNTSIFWNNEIPVLLSKVGHITEIIIEVF